MAFTEAGLARVREVAAGTAWGVAHGGEVHAERADAIHRISSMSKPITAVAAMALVEDGTLALDDPVDPFLPELAEPRVLRDPAGPVDDTVPAERPVTLRDLLTFRMGTGMDFTRFGEQPVMDALAERGLHIGPPAPQQEPPPDEWMARLGSVPLERQPGERWLYHLPAEVLGVLLARAAGATLGAVLRDRVLGPLGMTDTGFWVPAVSMDRFGGCVLPDGAVYDAPDGQWSSPPPFESGGGGLVSTVADLLAFATMLRDGGARVLEPDSVALMTTDHLTVEQRAECSPDPSGDTGWGFGMSVRAVDGERQHAGAYGWVGGLGSLWFTDPVDDLIVVVLTDRMLAGPGAADRLLAVVDAAHDAVT